MYNVFHNNTVYDLHLFCYPIDGHSHNTRNVNHNYFVFPAHTSYRKNFIVHTGIMLWNKLPLILNYSVIMLLLVMLKIQFFQIMFNNFQF